MNIDRMRASSGTAAGWTGSDTANVRLTGPTTALEGRHDGRHGNHVLCTLCDSDLSLLDPHLEAVSLDQGAVLQEQDCALDHVYFLHDGMVSLLTTTPNGETIEIASVGRRGAVCAVLQPGLRDAFVTGLAQTPLRASRVAAARLQAIVAESEPLSAVMTACRDALLVQMRQNVLCGGLHSFESRLSRWLLQASDCLECDTIPVTQGIVAQRLGVQRTTVTLIASKLQDSGAILWRRSRVEILHRSRLEASACACYAAVRNRMDRLLPVADATSAERTPLRA